VVTVDYGKEYGKDQISMHVHEIYRGKRVLIIDDLLATGGTAKAAGQLIRMYNSSALKRRPDGLLTQQAMVKGEAHAEPIGFAFVVELPLGGRALLEEIAPVFTILSCNEA
jgi:hypoxanthine phosphoribosyltransferase